MKKIFIATRADLAKPDTKPIAILGALNDNKILRCREVSIQGPSKLMVSHDNPLVVGQWTVRAWIETEAGLTWR